MALISEKNMKEYKKVAISAVITAFTVAVVNALFLNSKGLAGATSQLKALANKSDLQTKVNVNNRKWLLAQLEQAESNPEYNQMATQKELASLAFVALYTKYPDLKERVFKILNSFRTTA